MALLVANWTDKQLDELTDLLHSADYSAVASFIAKNFLCQEGGGLGRIMTDPAQTTLRVTLGTDTKTVNLSAGVFLLNNLVSQIDTTQTINILDTTSGTWGVGLAPDATNPRWDIVCVKWNEQYKSPDNRWFVDDSVVPNTYHRASVNTQINKAYYDIHVEHGIPDPNPVVPTYAGYWTIAEILVPPLPATELTLANIHDTDTIGGSQHTPKNWVAKEEATLSNPPTRVLRLEFWSTLFSVDHDMTTGYHRAGAWHIGSTAVTASGDELNQALDGIGATVTAAHLTKLTDGSSLAPGELHNHGNIVFLTPYLLVFNWTAEHGWTDIPPPDVSIVPVGTRAIILDYGLYFYDGARTGAGTKMQGEFIQKGAPPGNVHVIQASSLWYNVTGYTSIGTSYGQMMIELDASRIFQARLYSLPQNPGGAGISFTGKIVGYLR